MIPYQTIVVACAIGVLPVLLWLAIVSRYNQLHQRGANFFMRLFFLGVLSALPASILEISLNELDSQNQIVQALQSILSWQPGATLLALLISAILVALIEELSKGVSLWMGAVGQKFKIHNDGLLFGALVGLAFAVTENGVYFALAMTADSSSPIFSLVILRFLISTTAHVIYSGLMGKFLADAALTSDGAKKFSSYGKAILIPVGIHSVFNWLLSTTFSWLAILMIIFGAGLIWISYKNNSFEREV